MLDKALITHKPGLGKLWPAGQVRPLKPKSAACEVFLSQNISF